MHWTAAQGQQEGNYIVLLARHYKDLQAEQPGRRQVAVRKELFGQTGASLKPVDVELG